MASGARNALNILSGSASMAADFNAGGAASPPVAVPSGVWADSSAQIATAGKTPTQARRRSGDGRRAQQAAGQSRQPDADLTKHNAPLAL